MANDFDDRLPGRGQTGAVPIEWATLLNVYAHGKGIYDRGPYITRFAAGDSTAGVVTCPGIKEWGFTAIHPYTYNRDASGGEATAGGYQASAAQQSEYGGAPNQPAFFSSSAIYRTGARSEMFRHSSEAVLMREQETSGLLCTAEWQYNRLNRQADGNGVAKPTQPTWSAHNAKYSFRHSDAGNFLFVDGHASSYKLADAAQLNHPDHYEIEP